MHARRARHDDVAGRASSRPARRGPLRDALRAAVGGGGPGAAAMVLQVVLLMWLRTTINVQMATGASFATVARSEGGAAASTAARARARLGPRRTHARRALIGFACSAVSDTTSNSIRVVKVYVQTAPEPLSYGAALARVVADRGVWGLLFSGLPAKLLCNGVSSVVFSVIWKTLMDRRRAAPGSPRKRDDGDGGNDDDDPEAGLLSRA
ncbi:mitochondrial carrier protein [Aureococcus anophagefferens]|nr:mitochondrial carrier protein [Aureococcus anophagefferens]